MKLFQIVGVAVVALAASGCAGEVGVGLAPNTTYDYALGGANVDPVSFGVEPYYYGGVPYYWYGGYWYYNNGGRWGHYSSAPGFLHGREGFHGGVRGGSHGEFHGGGGHAVGRPVGSGHVSPGSSHGVARGHTTGAAHNTGRHSGGGGHR